MSPHHPASAERSTLDSVLGATQADIPECVGVGVVNMQSGVVLAYQAEDPESEAALELAAAAASELFEGRDVLAVENTFNRLRGNSVNYASTSHTSPDCFREVIILSGELVHVFQRGKRNQRLALVVLSRASANLSLVLTKARRAVDVVEAIELGEVAR